MRTISTTHFHNINNVLRYLSNEAKIAGHDLAGWGVQIGGDLGYGVRFIDNRRQLVTYGTKGGRSLALAYYVGQVGALVKALRVELSPEHTEMFKAAQMAVWAGPRVLKAQNGWADEMDAKLSGAAEIEAFFERGSYGWAAPTVKADPAPAVDPLTARLVARLTGEDHGQHDAACNALMGL